MITYNKLIRDRILEKIESNWWTAKYHIATEEEFGLKLPEKLNEEVQELNQAKTTEEIKNELADIFKVIDEIRKFRNINEDEIKNELADVFKITEEVMKLHNISEEELKIIKQKKDEKAWGFDKRIILEEASEY